MADTKFKFCENCGRKVSLNGQLCARCGADLGEGADLSEGGGGEAIVGSIDNVKTTDNTRISLVFTSNRVIVAETQRAATALLGAGLLTVRLSAGGARDEKERKFRTSTPEEIIGAHKNNYAVPYSEITQLRVRKPTVSGMWGPKWGNITWTTTLKEEKFKLAPSTGSSGFGAKKYLDELEKTLESLLPKLKQRLYGKLIVEN